MNLLQKGDYYFDVIINGERKVHIKNSKPERFFNVEAYSGNNLRRCVGASSKASKLTFCSVSDRNAFKNKPKMAFNQRAFTR